ncbi:hypothetical protein ACPB8Q_00305 [Methanocaldococcus indicus]|uniref:hypothetical protein n=1 Tax=Methanocaldococcus indicus TaxID=213231 RepID=UPI003C6D04BC
MQPIIVEIKDRKNELIFNGEKKLRELYDTRIKLELARDMNNPNVIEKLEEKEQDLVYDLSKIDLAIKTLEALEYIIENNIFESYWENIEKKYSLDDLLEIVVSNGLNIKKICLDLYERENINDKKILDNILKLPDEEVCEECKDKNAFKKMLERIKMLKEKLKGE